MEPSPLNFLCLASYEKGHQTLQELKRQGCRVFLLTSLSLKDKAEWPRESLDDIFYLEDRDHDWDLQQMLRGVSHLAKTVRIDRILALDDFDVEKAALLREHFRLPGLGETAARYFRDKLAMRMGAAANGIRVPDFSSTFNFQQIDGFLQRVPAPWILKPRFMAGAIGIAKFSEKQELWSRIHSLGDRQSFFVLERFVPGDIFHVDSIWFRGELVYSIASAYGTPPFELTTEGGIFTTQIVELDSEIDLLLKERNQRLLRAFGLTSGVSHTEFLRGYDDGEVYFLETSARVGGAHIADLIEQATGINLWTEWAKCEVATAENMKYNLPTARSDYAGLLVSLARQEWPDTSGFTDLELVWRLKKRNHVGFIVKSSKRERVQHLLTQYSDRVRREYLATAPPTNRVNE
jgi:hypothetical protein